MTDIKWPAMTPAAPVANVDEHVRQLDAAEQVLDKRTDEALRMHPSPELDATDPVAAAQAELASIGHAAGGFPNVTTTVSPPPMDPAAQELLAAPSPQPLTAMATKPDTPPAPPTFAQALSDGTIPTYADQPADVAVDPTAPPLDPATERAAWQQLIDYVNQKKDPGTTVTMVDLDTFSKGLG